MHRILTGILGLLVLYLAADHARLQDRNRFLEGKLAARPERAPRPAPVVVREIPEAPPVPAATLAASPLPNPTAVPASASAEIPAPPRAPGEAPSEVLQATPTQIGELQAALQIAGPKDPLETLNLA